MKNQIAKTATISPQAQIGKGVKIGNFTIVHDNAIVADGVTIEDYCTIGYPVDFDLPNRKLMIGKNSHIRSHSVIYEGCDFSGCIQTGHHVMVRENTIAGRLFSVGSYNDIEGDCTFGDCVRLHGYVHVGKGSKIGSFVWLYSLVTLTNDPLPPLTLDVPVILEDGVVVCLGSTVMPGAVMRKGSYAAANCQVKGEIEMGAVVKGPEAEQVGHVSTLIDFKSMKCLPWMKHALERYPEDEHSRLLKLSDEITASRINFSKDKKL